jgi:hypothetical protein
MPKADDVGFVVENVALDLSFLWVFCTSLLQFVTSPSLPLIVHKLFSRSDWSVCYHYIDLHFGALSISWHSAGQKGFESSFFRCDYAIWFCSVGFFLLKHIFLMHCITILCAWSISVCLERRLKSAFPLFQFPPPQSTQSPVFTSILKRRNSCYLIRI